MIFLDVDMISLDIILLCGIESGFAAVHTLPVRALHYLGSFSNLPPPASVP